MKPKIRICEECGVRGSTYTLIDGQKKTIVCELCLKDKLFEAVNDYDEITFNTSTTDEIRIS